MLASSSGDSTLAIIKDGAVRCCCCFFFCVYSCFTILGRVHKLQWFCPPLFLEFFFFWSNLFFFFYKMICLCRCLSDIETQQHCMDACGPLITKNWYFEPNHIFLKEEEEEEDIEWMITKVFSCQKAYKTNWILPKLWILSLLAFFPFLCHIYKVATGCHDCSVRIFNTSEATTSPFKVWQQFFFFFDHKPQYFKSLCFYWILHYQSPLFNFKDSYWSRRACFSRNLVSAASRYYS